MSKTWTEEWIEEKANKLLDELWLKETRDEEVKSTKDFILSLIEERGEKTASKE